MASLPTIPIQQIPQTMDPDASTKPKDQASSTAQPLGGEPALNMAPYQVPSQSNPLANHPALDLNIHKQPGLEPTAQPPQLRTPLASEPADQWASSTLGAVTDENFPSAGVETPGPTVPGAYPSLLPSNETVAQDLQYAKEVAASALQTAGQYAASALNAAKGPATQAAQTVGAGLAQGASVAGQTAANAASVAGSKAGDVANAAGNTALGAATTAGNTAVDAKNTAVSGAASAGQATVDTTRSVGQSAASTVAAAPGAIVDTTKSVGQSTTSTVAAAPSGIMNTIRSAGGTAAQYLPQPIANYLSGSSTESQPHSTAVTDPTGNMKNGLEALDGTSFAKLPEEARVAESNDSSSKPHLMTISDTTGNSNNGLEGLSGKNLAKLPEESRTAALPSHADEHSKLSTGGVGALPGNKDETGVAKLPAERREEAQPAPYSSKFLNSVVVNDPSNNSTALPPRNVPENPANAASTHQPNFLSQGGGADTDASTKSLAGTTHTNASTGTAFSATAAPFVPNPSAAKKADQDPSHGAVHRDTDDHRGPETLREHDDAARKKSGEQKPTDTLISSAQHAGDKLKPKTHDRHAGTGESKPVHESARTLRTEGHAPPVPEKAFNTATGASTTTNRLSAEGSRPTTADRESSGSGDSASKKPGFMGKMKGEMKVLSGKMTHNEEKIEEGKRLLGKN